MRNVEYESYIWNGHGYDRQPEVRVIADQSEADKLKRACENIGVHIFHDYYSVYTRLTPKGFERLQEALANPKPTRQEIQNAGVWGRFVNAVASSQTRE